ncbi:MAG: hypothetical protein QXD59_00305 [Candidatus Caldarchaeum sp.]
MTDQNRGGRAQRQTEAERAKRSNEPKLRKVKCRGREGDKRTKATHQSWKGETLKDVVTSQS